MDKIIRNNFILSADDFGKSEKANENILRLARQGKLDRVSVMIDGDFSKAEIAELLAAGVKLDIHFELIWQKRRRRLLHDNPLRQGIVFLVNYMWGDWPVPENPRSGSQMVGKEWHEQIEKFRKIFGRLPDGISSHEHTHYFPAYFKIAIKFAKKFELQFIRFGGKGFLGKRNLTKSILNSMRILDRRKFLSSKINSSDYFASLDWIEDIDEFSNNIPTGEIEIACHPEREEELELVEKYF